MNERLQRLIQLWDLQLEGKLEVEDHEEFEAMMQDAGLLEAFSEHQAEKASAEPEPEINWKRLDRRIRRLSLKQAPDLLVIAVALAMLGVAGGVALMFWQPAKKTLAAWQQDPAPFEKAGFDHVVPRRESRPRPPASSLQAPPEGENPLRVEAGAGGISIYVDQAGEGQVTLDVVDLSGRVVRRLYEGRLGRGLWSFAWDGKLHGGRLAGQGAYEIRLSRDRELGDYRQPVRLKVR